MDALKITISMGPFPGAPYAGHKDWTFYDADLQDWYSRRTVIEQLWSLDSELEDILTDGDSAENDGGGPWLGQVVKAMYKAVEAQMYGKPLPKLQTLVLAGVASEGEDFDVTIHIAAETYQEEATDGEG